MKCKAGFEKKDGRCVTLKSLIAERYPLVVKNDKLGMVEVAYEDHVEIYKLYHKEKNEHPNIHELRDFYHGNGFNEVRQNSVEIRE